jgi:hypothetical protein
VRRTPGMDLPGTRSRDRARTPEPSVRRVRETPPALRG